MQIFHGLVIDSACNMLKPRILQKQIQSTRRKLEKIETEAIMIVEDRWVCNLPSYAIHHCQKFREGPILKSTIKSLNENAPHSD